MRHKQLSLDEILQDERAQPRVELHEGVVEEYAEQMQSRFDYFPGVTVFSDGGSNWLADGFHRVEAARRAGRQTILAATHKGTLRDAIAFSLSANARHGLRRSAADKRRAVRTMLQDEEWGKSSDSEIARQCQVSRPLVAEIRKEFASTLHHAELQDRTVKARRNGTTYEMQVPRTRAKKDEKKLESEPASLGQASDDEAIITFLIGLSSSPSSLPAPEMAAVTLKQRGAALDAAAARQIGSWFDQLAARLDDGDRSQQPLEGRPSAAAIGPDGSSGGNSGKEVPGSRSQKAPATDLDDLEIPECLRRTPRPSGQAI